MKRQLVPAIMPRTWRDLKNSALSVRGASEMVQVDIMDGLFVSKKTWPFPMKEGWLYRAEEDGLPYWRDIDYELDLMINAPEATFSEWASLGPKAIVVHYESIRDWDALLVHLEVHKEYIQLGLSFDDDTPWEEVRKHLEGFSYVQCMGIDEIGAQGNPFSSKVLDNIAAIQATDPGMMISVDGSVNLDTLPGLREAGVSRFVAGSAVFEGPNPRSAIEQLQSLLQ
jgi:ribulose-phosphate 3-epimerase